MTDSMWHWIGWAAFVALLVVVWLIVRRTSPEPEPESDPLDPRTIFDVGSRGFFPTDEVAPLLGPVYYLESATRAAKQAATAQELYDLLGSVDIHLKRARALAKAAAKERT